MIKLSDYVTRFLVAHGITDLFMVSGGGIMHLMDSVGRQEGLRYWCNYHEQACAVSAEGYAKLTRRPCACLVTVGPAGINALSGVAGAWVDSVPMLVLTGQVRRDLIADYGKVRQYGPQEGDVVGLARHVTKYAVTVLDPARIRFELEKALHLATSGRPGPVWIDLPLDVQAALVEEDRLEGFEPEPDRLGPDPEALDQVAQALVSARRPLLLAGNGIHWAHAGQAWLRFLERWPVPVVVPYSAKDVLWEDHPLNMGVMGYTGQRRANFALQNADLLVSLGSGLCVSKTGFNLQGFAPRARKILVDIDPGQLHHQALKPDLAVLADLGRFLERLAERAPAGWGVPERWREACAHWRRAYPVITPDYFEDPEHVNTYVFMDRLAEALPASGRLVTGNGLDVPSFYQAFRVKRGQRTLISGNWGAMGWDLPMAIGACVAEGPAPTVVVTGDGSLQWNVQELLTIGAHRLPVAIFVFNNQGYTSIRGTQNAFFEGRFVGADPASGVFNPDFRSLAAAYGLAYDRIAHPGDLDAGIRRTLAAPGPILCEVKVSPSQFLSPKASAFRRPDGTLESRPLEDMAPFLPREEIRRNMTLFDDPEPQP